MKAIIAAIAEAVAEKNHESSHTPFLIRATNNQFRKGMVRTKNAARDD